MEDIAFNDWPGQPVDSGGNAWLPAYGFQTPSALLEREDFLGNPDADYFLQSTSTQCLYLETIHEETSDDLRSDSDMSDMRGSSPLGWLATDSETDSVICMDATNDSDCESDREIACPIKRRRQENLLSLPPEDDYQSLSRSSSLLQFETLEKQCQEISSSTPSIYSQFSLDSLESHHRKSLDQQQKKINSGSESSDTGDSESTLAPSCTNLKPWHSFDNLTKNPSKKEKISAENLSEDSGYSDHMYSNTPSGKVPKKNVVGKTPAKFSAYDCEVFQKFQGNFGASCQNLSLFEEGDWMRTKNINIEKSSPTSECRTAKYNCTSASEPNLLLGDNHSTYSIHQGYFKNSYSACISVCSVPKNLDLFGDCVVVDNNNEQNDSIAAKNWDLADFATKTQEDDDDMSNFKREGSYAEAMTNRVDLSDDEHGLCYKKKPAKTPIVEFDKKMLHAISESIHSINSGSIADAYLSNIYSPTLPPLSSRNVASTPNLAVSPLYIDRLTLEEERRRSVQDVRPRKSSLATHSTSTSCVSDADDTNKTVTPCESTNSKGVHFSPVVSEVNWQDDSQSTTTVERESSSYSLSSTPERESVNDLTKKLLDFAPPAQPQNRYGSGSQPNLNRQQDHYPPQRDHDAFRFHSTHSQSQPDVSKLKRRGSQLIKKDGDGCIVKAYVDGDGIQYKHTHLEIDSVGGSVSTLLSPPNSKSHVYGGRSVEDKRNAVAGMEAFDVHHRKTNENQQNIKSKSGSGGGGKIGGFFSRLTSFRFSNRKDDKKKKKSGANAAAAEAKRTEVLVQPHQRVASRDDYIYIPLKGPNSSSNAENERSKPATATQISTNNNNNLHHLTNSKENVRTKPPLPKVPPRVVGASVKRGENVAHNRPSTDQEHQRRRRTIDSGESCPRPMEPMGLIETDLDTEVTVITSGPNVKTRSLLNLGAEPRLGGLLHASNAGHDSDSSGHKFPSARPHKSMEFLLDKQNLKVVEPPENELQKGERVMSEHQLRVQRSLQKLTVPEWYKPSQVPREGFLLKKHSNRESRWTGTSSKTTSLSSLGSSNNHSPVILSPTSANQPFIRWSTSKLNSTASSPCASTRSSFNARQPNGSISPSSVRSSFSYRQPYMGWRSQERLNKPRTPAERLANSLLAQANQHHINSNPPQESPEIQTSIKEVTSAIVHYVSGLKPDSSDDSQRSRSVSPRGSQKLCWLESSFVGIRPLDSPQTPVSLTENQPNPPTTLRLELQTHNDVTLLNATSGPKPSPGSTTLEDVLDSLLGLPASDRAPSPSLQGRRHVDGVS